MFAESVSSTLSIWASVNSWFTPTVLFVVLNLMIGTIAIASNLGTQKSDQQRQPSEADHPQYVARSPSVLQRLKSINPYSYRSEEPAAVYEKTPEIDTHYAFQHPQLARSPSLLQRLKSFNFYADKPDERGPDQPSKSSAPALQKTEENRIRYEEEEPKEAELSEDGDADQGQDQEPTLDDIYSQLQGDHFSRTKSDTKPTAGEFPTRLPMKMKKSASSKSAFSHFEEEEIVETRRPATVKEGRNKMAEIDDEVDAKADDFINRFKQQLKLQRLDSIMKYKEMVGRATGK